MKATDIIRRDHRTIESLFDELNASDPSDNREIEDRLFAALASHEKMEDTYFYSALDDALEDDDDFEKLEDEQKLLEAEVAAAKVLPVGRTMALKAAMPKILEHAKQEETTILIRAEAVLGDQRNEEIGLLMEPESATATA